MSLLLDDAVVSIQLGLEDFASDDERRGGSAARNLYAGVLLLCKEVLRKLSPPTSNDVLIRTKKKAVKDADGTVRFVGEGKKTIDRAEIEETFKQLQLAVDLSKLRRLAEIRNDIEHMHARVGPALIQRSYRGCHADHPSDHCEGVAGGTVRSARCGRLGCAPERGTGI